MIRVRADGNITNRLVSITGEQFHHLIHVLRLQPGDCVIVTNRGDMEAPGFVKRITNQSCEIETGPVTAISRESPLRVVLVQAVLKGDRMSWLLEKAVELGVAKIILVISQYSVPRGDELWRERKHCRWQAIVDSAARQSGRTRSVPVYGPLSMEDIVSDRSVTTRLLLSPDPRSILFSGLSAPTSPEIWLAVGPEGGFSKEESARLVDASWQAVSIGTRTFRADTAGLVALTLCQYRWGDF